MSDIGAEMQEEQQIGKALAERVMTVLRDPDGRNRVEDLIGALASITGERCIEAAGDFNPRDHNLVPGQRVFSDKVNELLTGDQSEEWSDFPATSVCGLMWAVLPEQGFEHSDFPSMTEVFRLLAASEPSGAQEDWGRVPLSIPPENYPRILPIRINYESRGDVDAILAPFGPRNDRRLRAATFALIAGLIWVSKAIDRTVALTLALEMVNGTAKMAPMTPAALEQRS